MTTKTLTCRVPIGLYQRLITESAQQGVHLSAYLRTLLQREYDELYLEHLRKELLETFERKVSCFSLSESNQKEILYLVRAIANNLNPQINMQVKSRLSSEISQVEV